MKAIAQMLRHKTIKFLLCFGAAVLAAILASTIAHQTLLPKADAIPLAGGDTTVLSRSSHAYEQPAPNLSAKGDQEHRDGDAVFDAVFVTAPARVNPGLGPVFNNTSCTGCHLRNGRGLPETGQMLVRVSHQVSKAHPEWIYDKTEGAIPVDGLGTQIQDHAVYGQAVEATVSYNWQEDSGQYPDSTPYRLRRPQVGITLASGEPLQDGVMTSVRLPPPIFGLGLLEALPEETILALADANDRDGDGISGRVNQVWDVQKQGLSLGRFGLKANQPNLLQQSAAAYVNDMGVTNPLYPATDGSTEIDAQTLKLATVYAQTLAVPARTLLDDPQVQRGEQLFTAANCVKCHVAELRTGRHEYSALANQTIHPYTDLLLHDMGEGLADQRPDFKATGQEWRTPPLWGLGVAQTVLPYASYLHDGRARTLEEAILWHGGEAQTARDQFMAMAKTDRQAMVRFLNSL